MHEKPETRDVVDDVNPEGGRDNEKTMDVQKKPEKKDDINSNFNVDFNADLEYNEDVMETVEMQMNERPGKRYGAAAPASHTTLDSPLLKQRLS
jgi:hypothetical protein